MDSESQENLQNQSFLEKELKFEVRRKFFVEKPTFIVTYNINGDKLENFESSLNELDQERKTKGK